MCVCDCSQGLADSAVVAKVNGEVWDLDRPLTDDSEIELLKFCHDEGNIFDVVIVYLSFQFLTNPHKCFVLQPSKFSGILQPTFWVKL